MQALAVVVGVCHILEFGLMKTISKIYHLRQMIWMGTLLIPRSHVAQSRSTNKLLLLCHILLELIVCYILSDFTVMSRCSVMEIQRKWKAELDQELERKRGRPPKLFIFGFNFTQLLKRGNDAWYNILMIAWSIKKMKLHLAYVWSALVTTFLWVVVWSHITFTLINIS